MIQHSLPFVDGDTRRLTAACDIVARQRTEGQLGSIPAEARNEIATRPNVEISESPARLLQPYALCRVDLTP